MGITNTVRIPFILMARPLIAAHSSPKVAATPVPEPCADVPNAIPCAIGLLIFNNLNNIGASMAPQKPVKITTNTVRADIPPMPKC